MGAHRTPTKDGVVRASADEVAAGHRVLCRVPARRRVERIQAKSATEERARLESTVPVRTGAIGLLHGQLKASTKRV